jgi:hypothetical protein
VGQSGAIAGQVIWFAACCLMYSVLMYALFKSYGAGRVGNRLTVVLSGILFASLPVGFAAPGLMGGSSPVGWLVFASISTGIGGVLGAWLAIRLWQPFAQPPK